MDVSTADALDLATQFRLYAYDAYVLECARQYRTPLLSLDQTQRFTASSIGVSVIDTGS